MSGEGWAYVFFVGEKTIDDLLHVLKIPHGREPAYPEGNFRADFIVNGYLSNTSD